MSRPEDDGPLQARPVELPPVQPAATPLSAAPIARLAALAGVKAQVSVVAGSVHATVGDILNLKDGAVLTLDTLLNAPFDLVLNGTVIARGELVAVGEHFGIRVTQVQAGGA